MKLYVCGIAWQHEVGETPVEFFQSIEALKRECGCTEECGVVEVGIEKTAWVWVEPQNLSKYFGEGK